MEVVHVDLTRPECNVSSPSLRAILHMDGDLSPLLPYLNATVPDAQFFPMFPFIRFRWQGRVVAIEHDEIRIAPVEDDDDARSVGAAVLTLLRDVEARLAEITPDVAAHDPPSVVELYRMLPRRTGCRRCGHPSCMAFAAAMSRGEARMEECPERS